MRRLSLTLSAATLTWTLALGSTLSAHTADAANRDGGGIPAPFAGVFDIYVRLPGIPGSATTSGYTEWIKATSFRGGTVLDRASAPLEVSGPMDQALPLLQLAVADGTFLPTADLHVTRSGGGGGIQPVVTAMMTNVVVTNATFTLAPDGASQCFTLDFGTITWGYNAPRTHPEFGAPPAGPPTKAPEGSSLEAYLEIDGIRGSSTTPGYVDWIPITDAATEVQFEPGGGTGGGAGSGRTSFSPLGTVAVVDEAFPALLSNGSRLINDARLVLVRTTSSQQPIYEIDLDGVTLRSIQLAGEEGGPPVTRYALEFTRVEWTYYLYDQAGAPRGTVTGCWDVSGNTGC